MDEKNNELLKKNWRGDTILIRLMSIVLLIYPFGSSLLLGLQSHLMTAKAYPHFVFCIFFSIVWLGFILLISKRIGNYNKKIYIICILSITIRILSALLLKPQPISDFYRCFDFAFNENSQSTELLAKFPYNGIYATTIKLPLLIYHDIVAVQIFQSIITGIIPFFIYKSTYNITGNTTTSCIAALFYALCPSMVLYSGVMSTENFSQFFFSIMIFFFTKLWQCKQESNSKKWQYAFGGILALFISDLYKPIGSMMLLAFFVTEMIVYLIPIIINNKKNNNVNSKKKNSCLIVSSIICFMMIALLGKTVQHIGLGIVSHSTGIDVQQSDAYGMDNIGAVAYFGLSPVGGGFWNLETGKTCTEAKMLFDNASEANEYLLKKLHQEIQVFGPNQMLQLIKNKIRISWTDEWIFGYYATRNNADLEGKSVNLTLYDTIVGQELLYVVPNLCFWLIMLGGLMYYAGILLQKKDILAFDFWTSCFFGIVSIAFFILESQSRYKSTFVSLLCIVAAIGYSNIIFKNRPEIENHIDADEN